MNEKEAFSSYFRATQPKFARLYALVLTQADLTLPQYALLNLLTGVGIMSMTEASEKLHISKPAVTNLTDRLERDGYLKREAHPKDRRVYLLRIQPKGKRICHDIQSHVLQFLLKTLGHFGEGERKTIVKFYAALSETMDKELCECKGRAK